MSFPSIKNLDCLVLKDHMNKFDLDETQFWEWCQQTKHPEGHTTEEVIPQLWAIVFWNN